MKIKKPHSKQAFTLIELLTVIAIIGILAGIIIPTVDAVRENAMKTKTKAMFSQWVAALESFRQDYGYYPTFTFPQGEDGKFVQVLTGTEADADPNRLNKKNISYYTFTEEAFGREDDGDPANDDMLVDAFDNPNFGMSVDGDQDGFIDSPPTDLEDHDVPADLRGTVIFWTEKKGGYSEEVISW